MCTIDKDTLTPRHCSATECPGMSSGSSSGFPRRSKNLPDRGPKILVAMSAVIPPVKCTTRLPAKSTVPTPHSGLGLLALKNPLTLQMLWTTTGYTKAAKKVE